MFINIFREYSSKKFRKIPSLGSFDYLYQDTKRLKREAGPAPFTGGVLQKNVLSVVRPQFIRGLELC